MNLNPIISAKSFAHLLSGRGVVKASKKAEKEEDEEEEDDKEKKAEKEEDDKKDAKKAENDPPKDDKEDGKDAKKCEDDEEAEEEEDDKKEKKAKKKASAEGFDTATLARCESIFLSEHAAGKPDQAAHLAFRTSLSTEQAIELLAITPAPSAKNQLSDRMAKVKNPDVGASDAKSEPTDEVSKLVMSMNAAYNRATGTA